MSEVSSNITEANDDLQKLVEAAAGVVAGSKNLICIRKAMQYVGLSSEQQKSMALYQKVRRKAQRLQVVEVGKKVTPPPVAVDVDGSSRRESNSAVSSLTSVS